MKVNFENIYHLPIEKEEKILLTSLLLDLKELNDKLLEVSVNSLYIDFQDFHNEYSPERIDPCPDYYGYYTLRYEESCEIIGEEMTIYHLDSAMLLLHDFVEHIILNR